MGLVYMVHSDPRQSFGIISLLFFGYTISLSGRVSGEQRGGVAEDHNNDREFFQEEGLQGSFEIDLSDEIGMEVDNERTWRVDELCDAASSLRLTSSALLSCRTF